MHKTWLSQSKRRMAWGNGQMISGHFWWRRLNSSEKAKCHWSQPIIVDGLAPVQNCGSLWTDPSSDWHDLWTGSCVSSHSWVSIATQENYKICIGVVVYIIIIVCVRMSDTKNFMCLRYLSSQRKGHKIYSLGKSFIIERFNFTEGEA